MKTLFIAALLLSSQAAAYDYGYNPYQRREQAEIELNRNSQSFRQYDQDRNIGKLQSDLRYQQQLEQIERNQQGIYGERINPVNPYRDY